MSSLGGALSFGARRLYPFLLFASSHLPGSHLSRLSDSREIQCRNSAPQMRFFLNAPGYLPRPYDERIATVVGRFEAIRSRLGMRAFGTIFHGTLGGSDVSVTPQKRSPSDPNSPIKAQVGTARIAPMFDLIFLPFLNAWTSSLSGEPAKSRSFGQRKWPANCYVQSCNVTVAAEKRETIA